MRTIVITGFVGAALLVFAGCKPGEEKVPRAETGAGAGERVEKETREAVSATKDYLAEQSAAAREKLSRQLTNFDREMEQLKARAAQAGDKAKAEWEEAQPRLEAQRAEAAKRLEELKASSRETWSETVSKTEKVFADLEEDFKEAWARLKE